MLTDNAYIKGSEEVNASEIHSELRQERNIITIRDRRKINTEFYAMKRKMNGIDSLPKVFRRKNSWIYFYSFHMLNY